ncbi:MAG: Hpt domain-containing protein, partial [Thermoguttaceae bacterium]|nr:Hpt domain-containing protein [Thermoguttaceae bacterium]
MDECTGQELIHEFVAEALDALREVPRLLEPFRQDVTQTEPIHADVRTLHSIKGTAACLGLDAYKLFAHGLENVLAQL